MEYGFGFFFNFALFLLILFPFDDFLLEVEFVLGKVPIDFLLLDGLSGLCFWKQEQEHVIGPKTDSIQVEHLFFLEDHVPI